MEKGAGSVGRGAWGGGEWDDVGHYTPNPALSKRERGAMRMSLDFREICFFLPVGAQITHLYAYDRLQKIHTDATRPVGARGCCTLRKRPELTNQTDRRPGRCLHFGGSGEALLVRAAVCTWMKTGSLFSRRTFQPDRCSGKTLTAGNLRGVNPMTYRARPQLCRKAESLR